MHNSNLNGNNNLHNNPIDDGVNYDYNDDNDNDYKIDNNLENFLKNYEKAKGIDDDDEEEESQDSYEKRLDKEIEDSCNFKEYIDKLEVEEINDDELMKKEKSEIVEVKNNQIKKYKAYIGSLEKEKQDLIDNFKETTSILLEKIKELEEKNYGERPQTAVIMDGIKNNNRNQANINSQYNIKNPRFSQNNQENTLKNFANNSSLINNKTNFHEKQNNINNITNNNNFNVNIYPNTPNELKNFNIKNNMISGKDEQEKNPSQQERCVKCKKYFLKEDFAKHSLQCLRNPMIVCKICQEVIEEKDKESHISIYKDNSSIIKSVEEKNIKLFENCIKHGFETDKTLLDNEKGYFLVHYLCSFASLKFLQFYFKMNSNSITNEINLRTLKTKESPLVRNF